MVTTRRNGEGDGPDFEAMINAALANALPNLSTELRTQIYNDIRNGAAEDWITHMEKLFQVLGCPDNFKTRLAAFKLEGDALSWWTAHLKTQAGGEAYADTCTWATFHEIFYNRYFPVSEQQRSEREYGSIYQLDRENSVEYMQRFMRLIMRMLLRLVLQLATLNCCTRVGLLIRGTGMETGFSIGDRGRSSQVEEHRGRSDQGQSYRGQQGRGRQDSRGSGSYGQRGYDRPEEYLFVSVVYDKFRFCEVPSMRIISIREVSSCCY
ncbi:zinc finger, CCHC-type, Retrotransposon gag domain protein [Artemisia annua]|uniref:Zinc finger, CCHC-type, Retrotransposon gag domain protein n=1 Tax=Artemisia annua TaxID=35608 RepID=A0A2U1LR58_ARTAN|nr:zinc finger, CCHC-type, Retrotransposon gag domain protein [Artemisia annua]